MTTESILEYIIPKKIKTSNFHRFSHPRLNNLLSNLILISFRILGSYTAFPN